MYITRGQGSYLGSNHIQMHFLIITTRKTRLFYLKCLLTKQPIDYNLIKNI